MKDSYDFIVVGAGSAGCAVAARLSESANVSVLLIEAGPDANGWTICMPLAVDRLLIADTYNWNFSSEAEAGLGGRAVAQPRGRVLGGSSAINGMVYTRASPLDFEEWRDDFGCDGWGYGDVLPYFRRMEAAPAGDPLYRGKTGPLKISRPDPRTNVLNAAFIEAGRQRGYPVSADQNGAQHEGFAVGEQTICNGERQSTAVAYLTPEVRARANLTILPRTNVERILFEGRRAVGVKVSAPQGTATVRALRETVLCAGAIGTPHLLQLSGVGCAARLSRLGIDVVHDLPGVGRNLQDHPDLVIQFNCRQPVTLRRHAAGIGRIATGVNWFLRRGGVAASNQFEAAAYLRTRAGIRKPNLKLEFFPLALSHENYRPYAQEAFQIHMTLMTARSRGEVQAASADPSAAATIRFNYLDNEADMQTFHEAIALTRDIVAAPAFAPYAGLEIDPGADVTGGPELDAWIRSRVSTAYHPSCTCRMGRSDDPSAVTAPDLTVQGLSGLRIADASVMPHVVAANTNATTIMIGERAADFALGKPQLSPEAAAFWVPRNWQEYQR